MLLHHTQVGVLRISFTQVTDWIDCILRLGVSHLKYMGLRCCFGVALQL